MTDSLPDAIVKIDMTLQQIELLSRERLGNEALKIPQVSLSSDKMDLKGNRPS